MNLIFRLIRVVIQAFRGEKLDFFETSIVTFRVGLFDLDMNWHMTNSRYQSLMDLGRTDLLIRTGMARKTWGKGWGSVLGAATLRWRRGLRPYQRFDLHTHVLGWDDKWFYLDQKFISEGHILAHGIVKAVFVGKEGTVPAPKLVEYVQGKGLESPQLPESVLNWNISEEGMRRDAHAFAAKNLNP